MSNRKPGYVLLYRNIWENEIWNAIEPFDSRSAWVDLLLMANYEDRTIFFDGKIITVKRGQHVSSYSALAQRWRWDWKKVKRFLKLLESVGMIALNVSTHGITVTIVNYGKYQDAGRTVGRSDGEAVAKRGRSGGEAVETNKELIKNNKRRIKKRASPNGEKNEVQEVAPDDEEEAPLPDGMEEMTDEEQAAEMGVTLEQFRAKFRRSND